MRRVCSADNFWSLIFSHHVSVEQVPNKECYFITTQKMKFSIKDFFSKCDQIRRKLGICCCCCCCFAFHQLFFWWSSKFPQQNVKQSETRIGDQQLSVELCMSLSTRSTHRKCFYIRGIFSRSTRSCFKPGGSCFKELKIL